MTVSEDSLTVTYAKEISLKQALKPLLPGIALISGVEIILLVVSMIWFDPKATIGFFILACISVFTFLSIAIIDVKEHKNFRFVLDENGVTIFGQGKRSFIDWKNVAVAGSGSFFHREYGIVFIIFFTSQKYDVTNVYDRLKIEEALRHIYKGMNLKEWTTAALVYRPSEESEVAMNRKIYSAVCEYMDRYIPDVKRCDVDEAKCYKKML